MELSFEAEQSTLILVVDDEVEHLASLRRIFEKEGMVVRTATSGALALEVLRAEPIALVLCDVMMAGMTGIELLKATKTLQPTADVLVMTAFATVELAVEAMRAGAYDFIQKPFKAALIRRVVARALERQRLAAENRMLRKELAAARSSQSRAIIGRSPAIVETMELVEQAAPSTATVFIHGESGTGKELFARALHEASPRSDRPFIVVNCAALPESILEAELFGFEKGAFTGAVETKEGRIERAEGGTLFLDEVGELSPPVQAKLLRVLQEGEIERLGSTETRTLDFRLVSATNRNLEEMVRQRSFREDLYYRLKVIDIELPPLRDRPEDIPFLVEHFVHRFAAKNEKPVRGVSREALEALSSWTWPGNIRELENVIERAVVLARSEALSLQELPPPIRNAQGGDIGAIRKEGKNLVIPIGSRLEDVEQRLLEATLEETRGDKTLAAQLLGVAARTIYRKLETKRKRSQ